MKETLAPRLSRTGQQTDEWPENVTDRAGRLSVSALRTSSASLLLFVGPAVLGLPDFVGQSGALLWG